MNNRASIASLLLSVALLFAQAVQAEQRLIFDHKPLTVTLAAETESRLRFPEPVHVEVPERALQGLSVLQPTPSMLYVTPRHKIEPVRIIARNHAGTRVYVLDIQADSIPPEDIRIEVPALIQGKEPREGQDSARPSNPPQVLLTRYASQTLYGPDRLAPSDSHIRRVPVDRQATPSLIRSHQGESWRATPVAAWAGYGYHITAVEIINLSAIRVALDPRRVMGNWSTITAQHTWLGPAGTLEDRTTLYLVSRQPWQVAREGLSYGH